MEIAHCHHHTARIVTNGKSFASACCECTTDEQLNKNGYRDATPDEVEVLMNTTKEAPPLLNPEWLKMSPLAEYNV